MEVSIYTGHSPEALIDSGASYITKIFGRGAGIDGITAYEASLQSIADQASKCGGNAATTNIGFIVQNNRGVTQCLLKGHAFFKDPSL